jgi:hypothetical protein
METDKILNELLLQFRGSPSKKKRALKFKVFKRISPFLLLAVFLIFLFPYLYFTGKPSTEYVWFIIVLFFILEINILFADFVLWNYFKNKRKLILFFVETMLSALIIYLLT